MQERGNLDTSNAAEHARSLALCLDKIERELGWGPAGGWSHQEFISLSEKVLSKTEISLSANTLKRVWGRLPYESSPSTSTLNALARFLDFENWASFRNSLNGQLASSSPFLSESENTRTEKRQRTVNLVLLCCAFGIVLATTLFFSWQANMEDPLDLTSESQITTNTEPSEVAFEARKTSRGVPNTIIFNYDLRGVDAKTFQIQQNWDERLRFDLDPSQHTVSSTYYLPGYWKAKLLADNVVLKETDVYIESNGWLGTINVEPTPIYFKAEEIVGEDIEISRETYANSVRNLPRLPSITYHFVENFDATLDHLSAEVVLRNSQQGGEAACRFTSIILLGSSGVVSIPLSIPGCVGDLRMRVSDVVVDGASNDLSSFGCDFMNSQKVGIELFESRALIYLNGALIQTVSYLVPLGDFAGFRAKFHGHGKIESVVVKTPDGDHLLEHG